MSIDTHITHCCVVHGCKYGDDDCPVASRSEKQEYPCEDCDTGSFNYEKVDGKNWGGGCINLFHGDDIINLISDPELAARIMQDVPERIVLRDKQTRAGQQQCK